MSGVDRRHCQVSQDGPARQTGQCGLDGTELENRCHTEGQGDSGQGRVSILDDGR